MSGTSGMWLPVLFVVASAAGASAVLIAGISGGVPPEAELDGPLIVGVPGGQSGTEIFTSAREVREFLEDAERYDLFLLGMGALSHNAPDFDVDFFMVESMDMEAGPAFDSALESDATGRAGYSTTNIQVGGVDEPDFLKNDGRYIYVMAGGELIIVEAHPAESAGIVFRSDFGGRWDGGYSELLLNGDRLAVIYETASYRSVWIDEDEETRARSVQVPVTNVMILDVSDRAEPQVSAEYSIDGWYHDARMIGQYAYVVTKSSIDRSSPLIPEIRDGTGTEPAGGDVLFRSDVYRFGSVEDVSLFTTLSAIDLSDEAGEGAVSAQTHLTGYGDVIHVSENGVYLTFEKNYPSPDIVLEEMQKAGVLAEVVRSLQADGRDEVRRILEGPLPAEQKLIEISRIALDGNTEVRLNDLADAIPEWKIRNFADAIRQETSRTAIHKIAVEESPGNVSFRYVAGTEVEGSVLNQFSMDESGEQFRIATTVELGWPSFDMYNNVYVLDVNLDLAGSLEEIAPGERIYSARFLGDKLYMVTFRQIDPFFVIDLSGKVPEILGDLKIPGFSNYLHPYGRDGIIGIGVDVSTDGISRGGVKIAMFNVSDFHNPRLRDEIVIGTHGTTSAGLDDHKAVLIDEGKRFVSLPIQHNSYAVLALGESLDSVEPYRGVAWSGFHVYTVRENGTFGDAGTVLHGEYASKHRSLYIEDFLYTVTDDLLVIHRLDDLSRSMRSISLE